MQQNLYPAASLRAIARRWAVRLARRLRQPVVLALLAAPLVASGARAACEVSARTSVTLTPLGGVMTVPLEINGVAAPFILDTGAQRSVVSEAAAARLGLARDPWVGTTMGGIGGIDRRPNADPASLELGGVPLARQTLSHDRSLTVVPLLRGQQAGRDGRPITDGLLGRDYLSAFDLELDFPDRRLTLYDVRGCRGRFLPWTDSYVSLPFALQAEAAVVLPVVLDGTPLKALLETGATSSLLAATGMFRTGMDVARIAGDPANTVVGLGPHPVVMHRHVFKSLQIEGETMKNPSIWVAPVRLRPIVDMLLGMDWMASRRIWISFSTRQVFFGSAEAQ